MALYTTCHIVTVILLILKPPPPLNSLQNIESDWRYAKLCMMLPSDLLFPQFFWDQSYSSIFHASACNVCTGPKIVLLLLRSMFKYNFVCTWQMSYRLYLLHWKITLLSNHFCFACNVGVNSIKKLWISNRLSSIFLAAS